MSSDTLITLIMLAITAVLIGFNGLYVFHEFAYVMLKPPQVKRFEAAGTSLDRLIAKAAHKLDHYLAVDQFGITVTSIGVGWIGQPVVADLFQDGFGIAGLPSGLATTVGFVTAFLLLTATQMIIGELVPKTVALRHPERVARSVTRPVEVTAWIFHPVIWALNGLGNMTVRAFGAAPQTESHGSPLPPEELNALIQVSARAGTLEADPILLRRMLHFSDIEARDLIVPRQDVVALEINQPTEEVLEIARGHRHTRFPVYRETIDDVVGILNIKDLVQIGEDGTTRYAPNWRRMIRRIPVLPIYASIEQVLHRLSEDKQPMVLLVDEFGGTAGVITVSDIADELTGSTEDIRQTGERQYVVKGETAVSTIEAALDIELGSDDHESESIGGLMMESLHRVPARGDRVSAEGYDLEVAAMRRHRVTEVRLTLPEERPAEVAAEE